MDKKTRLLYSIQSQIERIQGIDRELSNEGFEIRKSYLSKVRMPSPNAPVAVMEKRLSDLKKINKTSMKENAKSFTWHHKAFDPKTGEIEVGVRDKKGILKDVPIKITKDVAKRGSFIVSKQRAIEKKQKQWVGSVPESLFDLANNKLVEFYQANVVASGNDESEYIPGKRYGYRDSATMPAVDYVMNLWSAFENKYKGTEGQKIWFDSIKQKVTDVISELMNIEKSFGSAQQFVINDTAKKIARILSDKGLPPRFNDYGDPMEAIGTPWEPKQYDLQVDMDE